MRACSGGAHPRAHGAVVVGQMGSGLGHVDTSVGSRACLETLARITGSTSPRSQWMSSSPRGAWRLCVQR